MRLAVSAIAALLFLIMTPADAPALKLGRILGIHGGSINSLLRRGVRLGLRPYAYRSRAYYARRSAPSAAGVAEAQQGEEPQYQRAQPEAFWPGAPQDVSDYVLW